MDPSTRAWIASGVLLAGAILVGWLGHVAAAVPLLVAALAVGLLVVEASLPPELAHSAGMGDQAALANLAQDLELHGRGVHVPPRDTLERSRLFLPARDVTAGELPTLEERITIHRGPPGVLGLSLPPPGLGLEEQWAKLHGLPTGRGPEEAALHIRRALDQLHLGREVRVHAAKRELKVSFQHTSLSSLCRASRTELTPWETQGGCPTCSLVALLVARAFQAPVAYRGCQGTTGSGVELELEVLASS